MDFYKGREKEPHVREVFQRLGDIYFDQTKYPDAIAVYKALLAKWPYYSDAPRVQDRIVHAYEKDRNLVAAAKERETLGRSYTKGSDWYQHNRDNPEALAVARQLAEDALLTAATNVHAAAQACKTKWQENQKDTQEAGRVQEAVRDQRRALREVPGGLSELEAQLRVLGVLRRRALLLRAAQAGDHRLHGSCATRSSTTGTRKTPRFRMIKTYEEIIDGA